MKLFYMHQLFTNNLLCTKHIVTEERAGAERDQ